MKKLISAALSLAALTTLVSCASSSADTNDGEIQETTKPKRVSSSKIDPEIIGTWMNDTNGYRFQEDRKVTLFVDKSDYVHFSGDDLIVNDKVLSGDLIQYDGTNFRAYYVFENVESQTTDEMDILLMTNIGGNGSNFDGRYKITGGVVGESIADPLGCSIDELDMEVTVEGTKFSVTVNDYCFYETNSGTVDLFDEKLHYIDENASGLSYTYKIDGDTLSMYYKSQMGEATDPEVYTKVK